MKIEKIKLIDKRTELVRRTNSILLRLKRRIILKNANQCDWEVLDIQMKIKLIENKTEFFGRGNSIRLILKLKIELKTKRNGIRR